MTVESFAAAFDVSRETLDRLAIYHNLLERWNRRINLVGPSTIDAAWTRHFADSAQLLNLAPDGAHHWADLGSGGGFPGLVVAILAAEARPALRFTLIEADQRKATFLRTVARETGVTPDIVCARIEAAPPCGADVVSARALAPLPRLLPLADRHLAPGGVALFAKGAGHRDELTEALETWVFDCEDYPSKTDAEAVILKLEGIERVRGETA